MPYDDILNENVDPDIEMEIGEAKDQLTKIKDLDSQDVDISVEIGDARFVAFEYSNDFSEEALVYNVKSKEWKFNTNSQNVDRQNCVQKFCQARRTPQDRLSPVEDVQRSMTEFMPQVCLLLFWELV